MRSKSVWAWTGIGMWVLMAHFSGGSWPALILLAVICYSVMKLLPNDVTALAQSRLYCILQLVGIYLLQTQLLPMSAQYWPGKYAHTVIPSVLILLGLFSCMKRPERVGGILFWGIGLALIPVVLAGSKDLRFEWMLPTQFGVSLWMIPGLLLPLLAGFAAGERTDLKWYKWTVLAGVTMWIIVSGVLSQKVAANLDTPFRNASMSLTLGAYSRFESLVSVILTLGWYALSSLLFYAAQKCISGLNMKKVPGMWFFAILLLTSEIKSVSIPPEITVIYIIFVWLLFPVFDLKKISKKSEKSA